MAANTTRTQRGTKKTSANKKAQAVEFAHVDCVEIAAILLNKLDDTLRNSQTLAFKYGDPEVDITFFSYVLKANFTDKMITDLMNTNYGQGILMGYIVAVGEINEALDSEEAKD